MSRFVYCPLCDNLLHMKENKALRKLVWHCLKCKTEKEVNDAIVSHWEVNVVKEESIIPLNFVNDLTIPRVRKQCPKCNHVECCYIQKQDSKQLNLYFICCNKDCLYCW